MNESAPNPENGCMQAPGLRPYEHPAPSCGSSTVPRPFCDRHEQWPDSRRTPSTRVRDAPGRVSRRSRAMTEKYGRAWAIQSQGWGQRWAKIPVSPRSFGDAPACQAEGHSTAIPVSMRLVSTALGVVRIRVRSGITAVRRSKRRTCPPQAEARRASSQYSAC